MWIVFLFIFVLMKVFSVLVFILFILSFDIICKGCGIFNFIFRVFFMFRIFVLGLFGGLFLEEFLLFDILFFFEELGDVWFLLDFFGCV